MPKIGDRYIIEIDRVLTDGNGDNPVYRIKGFNTLVFDQNGIDKLVKYDEANKVALSIAYGRGYSNGRDFMQRKIKDVLEALPD